MSGKPLKIAVFGHKRMPSREGGIEVAVEELATRMAALGHEVTCYGRGGSENSFYKGVRLRQVPTWQRRGLAAVTSSFFAALAVAFSSADVCHIHGEGPAFMCFLPKLFGKRVVVTVHGLDWQREKWKGSFGAKYIRWGEKMAVRFADEIIVLSENAQKYFCSQYGRTTRFIPNGTLRPVLQAPRQITERFGLQKDGYLLFLGRLVPEKGIHDLIEAFGNTKTEKRLVIAGGSSDTEPYVRMLHARAAGDARVLFTGFVQGRLLEELYSNAYLYVLPSYLEGMPLSLLEALSYGNCCVVSDIPECAEVAENRAVLFPKGDVAALRDRLQSLCDDASVVSSYRESAADLICSNYCWDDVAKKTLELYR